MSSSPAHTSRTDVPTTSVALPHSRPSTETRTIFVVHGRNLAARDALFAFLRSIGLEPLEWNEAVQATGKPSPYTGEILDVAFSRAHAILVLFTPDDEARLREPFWTDSDPPHETILTGQARPNVLFEAGMAMARDQDRTILVELGDLRPFSDIAGRHTIRLNNTSQLRQELAQRLQAAGCPIDLAGTDWHSAGDFAGVIKSLEQESSEPMTREQSPPAEPFQLSEEARDLLTEATRDHSRLILRSRTQGGTAIQTNRKFFGEFGNPKTEAAWENVIYELLNQGFIRDPKGEGKAFEVTNKGFEFVDGLEASQ